MLKTVTFAVTSLLLCGVATAQPAPQTPPGTQGPAIPEVVQPPSTPPSPRSAEPSREDFRDDMDDEDSQGEARHEGHMKHSKMRNQSPKHGAHFKFERSDGEIHIKCAANEPTSACVDGAIRLMDKIRDEKR